MNRSSPYFTLTFRVDCKPNYQHFWETICAFNYGPVAGLYANRCAASVTSNEYRVMKRTGKGWVAATAEDMR